MFYEFLGSYLDLSAVVSVAERAPMSHSDRHQILFQFAAADEPYSVKVNQYHEWEMDGARQALRYVRRELAERGPVPLADRQAMPFMLDDDEIDLGKVRAVSSVSRHIRTSQQGGKTLALSDVWFDYQVYVEGRPLLTRRMTVNRDVPWTPLHTRHEKLLRHWMVAHGWRDVA